MSIRNSLCTLSILFTLMLVGCNSGQQTVHNTPSTAANSPTPRATASQTTTTSAKLPETIHADGVRRITPVELHDLLAKGEVMVVDVRTDTAYNQGHIPGAKLIPVENVLKQSKTLPRNKMIVTYCS